jgi:hypothetical protein
MNHSVVNTSVTGICAVIKKLFEAYVNSGHDVTNATQVFAALLSAGGIRNIKPSVIELLPGYLDKIVLCIGISKLIPGVSKEETTFSALKKSAH